MKKTKIPLGQLLLRGYRWCDQGLRRELSERGWPDITPSQSTLMAHVRSEGIRITELARRMGVTRQAAHHLVQELHQNGFVVIHDDPSNLSAKLVVLSPDGEIIVRDALAIYVELERALSGKIGAKAVKDLRASLESDWGSPLV